MAFIPVTRDSEYWKLVETYQTELIYITTREDMLMQWEEQRKTQALEVLAFLNSAEGQGYIEKLNRGGFSWRPLFFWMSLSSIDIASAVFPTSLLRAFVTRSPALASSLSGTTVFSTSFLTHIFSLPPKMSV